MIDDGVELDFLKTGQMIGLGIDHHPLAVVFKLDIFQSQQGDLQPIDHRQVVEASDLIGMGDRNILDLVA